MIIKFIARSTIYNPGDVACFPDAEARVLIARKAAVAFGEETRPAAPDKTPEKSEPPTLAEAPEPPTPPKSKKAK
jgi:hypothetical protein